MKVIEFYYDVVCPYAYLGSRQIEALAKRCDASLIWKPVVLGGIYKATAAPQGKNGSASDVMAPAKRILSAKDLALQAERHKVPLQFPSFHPARSISALRLILVFPERLGGKPTITHALYAAYWQHHQNISDINVLTKIAKDCGFHEFNEMMLENEAVKSELFGNTEEAVARGTVGVPACFAYKTPDVKDGKLFWGQDRLHFVEGFLMGAKCDPPRLLKAPQGNSTPKLVYFHDFSSPWSYLASTQVKRIARECNAELIYTPILVGALFKEVGTPNVPMLAISEAKRLLMSKDLKDWVDHWEVPFKFPSHFPLRTVLPLRIAIAEPALTDLIYKWAWSGLDRNIGDEKVLRQLVQEAGYDANALIDKANSAEIKEKLKNNTDLAVKLGACGVPTFLVNDEYLIWGQDRWNVVCDLLLGWKPSSVAPINNSRL